MHWNKEQLQKALCLYGVTDSGHLHGRNLEDVVADAIQGGVSCIQIREKHLAPEAFLERAKKVQTVCKKAGVPFLINDDVELAKMLDADGVHVGQQDMAAEKARQILGKDKIIGVSARTVEQALAAERAGADYLGVGAAFVTSTKADAVPVQKETIGEICRAVSIPVVAIGGIRQENLLQLQHTGIAGVAVVSAVFSAEDAMESAKTLRALAEQL